MNIEKYKKICEICDKLLLSEGATLRRVAIPWLHVFNEHPTNLNLYKNITNFKIKKSWFILNYFKSIVASVKTIIGSTLNSQKIGLIPKADVLIISHMLNLSIKDEEKDFYFGELPEFLVQKGLSTVVALHNHTNNHKSINTKNFHNRAAPRFILQNKMNIFEGVKVFIGLLKESICLYRKTNKSLSIVENNVIKNAAVLAVGPAAMLSLRFYFEIQKIILKMKPKAILLTYEGHAWERLAFAAARSINPSIHCIGYHHSVLFKNQHSIIRALEDVYEPDIICTAGLITLNILKKSDYKNSKSIIAVGTHRQEKLNIKFSQKINDSGTQNCLVIPDGTINECQLILNFVLKAALEINKINFIIRMHPVMPFSKLLAMDDRLKNLPRNLIISNQSIEEDFKVCRWSIYRGSGAAVRSLSVGIRPLYYEIKYEKFNIDPLYKLEYWKKIFNGIDDLSQIINADLQCKVNLLEEEWLPALEFSKQYYTPINLDLFCKIIQNLQGDDHEYKMDTCH